MAWFTFDVSDEPYPTGVFFEVRIVEPLFGRKTEWNVHKCVVGKVSWKVLWRELRAVQLVSRYGVCTCSVGEVPKQVLYFLMTGNVYDR